ncbi:MAG: hypothetical protein A2126_04875 [Candidatus Woykebacteria bacterium GWB1_45_5]|uniref:Uncharacterized protein n=1 Tax=Candidatus Woykebacteria bacterium GWB1_45_5 TaxID=1802592 RepID=A0A1G1W4Z4_9BACT|nr:MAG: hypothetical protein A2126_04875 [Candidatus Woykebacteria bacterium GWB1_45_5]
MDKKVLPFASLLAFVLGLLVLRLLIWGGQEVAKVPQAIAQPDPIVQGWGYLTVEDLEQLFDRFPVFWVGPEWQGHQVEKIIYQRSPGSPDGLIPPEETIDILYGTCDPPTEGPPEGRVCVRPLQIISEHLCHHPPERLAQGARKGSPFKLRGAQVRLIQSPPDQPDMASSGLFHFGESTVQISTVEGYEAVTEVFDAHLLGANPLGRTVAATAGASLPAPISEAECADFNLPPIKPLPTPAATALPTAASLPTAEPTAAVTAVPAEENPR